MLDKVMEPLLGAALDRVMERGAELGHDVAAARAGAAEVVLERETVRGLIRRVLKGATTDELTEALRDTGMARLLIPEWIELFRSKAREKVEVPLFRLALGLGVVAQAAILLSVVISATSGAKGSGNGFLGVMAFLAGLSFLLMKALLPKWFEVHCALSKRKAAQSERLTVAYLAVCFGIVAGHQWYLGHSYSSKVRPQLIVLGIFTCWTGIPLVLSWLHASRLFRMTDAEYARS